MVRPHAAAPSGKAVSVLQIRGRREEGIFTIRLTTEQAEWRNAVAFSRSPTAQPF